MKRFYKESSLLGLLSNYLSLQVSKNAKRDLDSIMDFLNLVTDALIISFVSEHFELSLTEANGFFFLQKKIQIKKLKFFF